MAAKKKSASSADAPKRRKKVVAKKIPAKKAKKVDPRVKKPASAKVFDPEVSDRRATAGKSKDKLLGKVDHYFDKINVVAMKLGDSLKIGDTVRIEGGAVTFTQQIASMQIEHELISAAKKGDEVGFKVKQKVREGYRVYKTV